VVTIKAIVVSPDKAGRLHELRLQTPLPKQVHAN
jgi:hypothetical protein